MTNLERPGHLLLQHRRQILGGLAGIAATAHLSFDALAAEPVARRDGMVPMSGGRLYFTDTGGSGMPIVFLHPATGSAESWGPQQAALPAAGHRVITYSRRGHWRSESEGPTAPQSAARDLHDLLQFLRLPRVHLVGMAAGGFVVPDYALSHPERLASISIVCSQGGVVEPDYRAAIERLYPTGFAAMPASFRELGPSYRAVDPAGVARWTAIHERASVGKRPVQQPDHNLLWPEFERIRVPTLVLAGGADLYAPPVLMRQIAYHIRGSRYELMPTVGHAASWEDPDGFNRILLDFIRSVDRASRKN